MQKENIERMVDAALMEGVIEAECMECGVTIHCELNASIAWCDICKKQVKVNNFMQTLGFI